MAIHPEMGGQGGVKPIQLRLDAPGTLRCKAPFRPPIGPTRPGRGFLESELETVAELGKAFDAIALQRAESLIDAHERFRKVLGGKRFKVVEPVLPMDLMGIYILLPDRGNQKGA